LTMETLAATAVSLSLNSRPATIGVRIVAK
jgi:hypothetical protein